MATAIASYSSSERTGSNSVGLPVDGMPEAGPTTLDPVARLSIDTFFSAIGCHSLLEFRKHINNLPVNEQVELIITKVDQYNAYQEKIHGIANIIEDIAKRIGIEDEVKRRDSETWLGIIQDAKSYRSSRDEQSEAIDKVYAIWPQAQVDQDIPNLRKLGKTTAKYLRALALAAERARLTYTEAKRYVLDAQYNRILNGGRGVSPRREVVAGDLRAAQAAIQAGRPPAIRKEDLKAIGCDVNARGLICDAEVNGDITLTGVDARVFDQQLHYWMDERKCSVQHPQYSAGQACDCHLDLDFLPGEQGEIATPFRTDHMHNQNHSTPHLNSTFKRSISPAKDIVKQHDDDEIEQKSELDLAVKRRKIDKNLAYRCGCSVSVPLSLLKDIRKWRGRKVDSKLESCLIQRWKQYSTKFCFSHSRNLMSLFGFKTKGLHHEVINQRLEIYHSATLQGKIGNLTTGNTTWQWFRRDRRPARFDDRLGTYKFFHTVAMKHGYELSKQSQLNTAAYLGIDLAKWGQDGSINLPLFKWWFTMPYEGKMIELHGKTISDVILMEFEMYDHHLRCLYGKSNYGWLRSMFHSLGQQVMRQDIVYFMAYCALRPDRTTNLITYPYYAKYQKPGDATFFRHVDVNLVEMVDDGRGKDQIQGSVSLDEEYEDDCTEIIPGMQHHIHEWVESLKGRPEMKLGGRIHNIPPAAFTANDAVQYGTNWTAVPCKAGDVRITQPQLPHGAKGPAIRVRRTMLPWYVALQDDLEHLEITEGGSFEDLSRAHRDLVSGPWSPSGHPNHYGDIPYAFPAAITLSGLGSLSDALVGRVRHSMPEVGIIKKKLFEGSYKLKDSIIQEWREKAVKAVVEGFQIVRQLEREAFGEKSYFNALDNGINPKSIVADARPTFDIIDRETSDDDSEYDHTGVQT